MAVYYGIFCELAVASLDGDLSKSFALRREELYGDARRYAVFGDYFGGYADVRSDSGSLSFIYSGFIRILIDYRGALYECLI